MANILVIDDDDVYLAVLETFLKELGHSMTKETNAEAFMRTPPKRYDLIVLDMQFPGGGAPQVAKFMSEHKEFGGVPIVFCSSMPAESVKKWFPEAPQFRYHTKPVDLDLFSRQISELLGSAPAPAANSPATAPITAAASEQTALARFFAQEKISSKPADAAEAGVRACDRILADAVSARASDIHLDPSRDTVLVRYRIDGLLRNQVTYPKSLAVIPRLRIMSNLSPSPAANAGPEEGSFDLPGGGRRIRARFSTFPSIDGEKVVIRILDQGQEKMSLGRLGLAPDVAEKLKGLIELPSGIFFVSGPTGSGKTTTLCAILQTLAREDVNIMTLEDPVEYQVPGVTHTQISPRTGFTFAQGLRGMLRQDPNVIVVGEVRDQETAEIALRAATTGHKIFTSIHAMTSVAVVDRLLAMGMDPYLISNGLVGVLAQQIIRRACAKCAQPAQPDPALISQLLKTIGPLHAPYVQSILAAPGGKFVKTKGCPACFGTGYQGRIVMFELLPIDGPMREAITTKASSDKIWERFLKSGGRSLLMDGALKVWSGWTTLEEGARAVMQL